MLIPLGTDRPLRRPTLATLFLMGLNVAIFTAGQAITRMEPERQEMLFRALELNPSALRWWNFISYAFIHADYWHLIGNLAFLWTFGPNVEDRFGRIGYLAFYLIGGAISGGGHILSSPAPVVGASGAIAAVTGAYLVLFPRTHIRSLFLLYFGVFSIPAWWFIAGRIGWDLFTTGTRTSGNVATVAHLAGYGFGIVVSLILLWTKLLSREQYDLFSISKHAARRRQFREAQYQAEKRNRRAAHEAKQGELGESAELARARSEVGQALSDSNLAKAASAYRELLEKFGHEAALLNRKAQYDLANFLHQNGDHATASTAYRIFITGYPRDPEIPAVRLLVGVINARYLNDPVQAKQDLAAAIDGLGDGPERDLAREILAELG